MTGTITLKGDRNDAIKGLPFGVVPDLDGEGGLVVCSVFSCLYQPLGTDGVTGLDPVVTEEILMGGDPIRIRGPVQTGDRGLYEKDPATTKAWAITRLSDDLQSKLSARFLVRPGVEITLNVAGMKDGQAYDAMFMYSLA